MSPQELHFTSQRSVTSTTNDEPELSSLPSDPNELNTSLLGDWIHSLKEAINHVVNVWTLNEYSHVICTHWTASVVSLPHPNAVLTNLQKLALPAIRNYREELADER